MGTFSLRTIPTTGECPGFVQAAGGSPGVAPFGHAGGKCPPWLLVVLHPICCAGCRSSIPLAQPLASSAQQGAVSDRA